MGVVAVIGSSVPFAMHQSCHFSRDRARQRQMVACHDPAQLQQRHTGPIRTKGGGTGRGSAGGRVTGLFLRGRARGRRSCRRDSKNGARRRRNGPRRIFLLSKISARARSGEISASAGCVRVCAPISWPADSHPRIWCSSMRRCGGSPMGWSHSSFAPMSPATTKSIARNPRAWRIGQRVLEHAGEGVIKRQAKAGPARRDHFHGFAERQGTLAGGGRVRRSDGRRSCVLTYRSCKREPASGAPILWYMRITTPPWPPLSNIQRSRSHER